MTQWRDDGSSGRSVVINVGSPRVGSPRPTLNAVMRKLRDLPQGSR